MLRNARQIQAAIKKFSPRGCINNVLMAGRANLIKSHGELTENEKKLLNDYDECILSFGATVKK